jgi:membrane protein implicated in regulation of membrane protease activity
MDSDVSGWLWLVLDVVMVAALGTALAYGVALWRRRRRSVEQASERATAQLCEREAERERKAGADRLRL